MRLRTLVDRKFYFAMLLVTLSSVIFSFSQAQNMFFHLLPGFVAPFTWVGLGGNANWNNSANWSTGVVPGAGNTAIFDDICTANCDPTINVAINVGGVNMKSTYAGTITQGVGNTITVGAAGWTQAAGTFAGAGATVTTNGAFNLSGGTYTATSGATTFAGNFTKTGGTYNHNSGQTIFSTSGTLTIAPSGVQFNNLTFTSSPGTFNLSAGTITVVGNLVSTGTHGAGAQGSINNGTIEVQGNMTLTGEAHGGTALIRINGTGAQALTGVNTGYISSVEINKPSGTLTLVNTIRSLGNWTWLAGTVDAGTSTIQFETNSTITPGSVNYNNITFIGDARTYSLNAGTMTLNGVLTLHSNNGTSAGNINNGTIEAKGNVTIAGNGQIGSALIRVNGTGAQTFTGAATGWIGPVEINKALGTLTLANTIRSLGNWTWVAGTVDAGTSTIQFEINSTITPGSFTYNNITFTDDGSLRTYSLNAGTLNVGGVLTFTTNHPTTPGNVNNGTINATGNVVFSGPGQSGSAILNFTGNANTTLTIGASAATLSTTHNVNKTEPGKVSLVAATSYSAAGRDFTITSGTLDMAGFNFTINDALTISTNGILICNGGVATAGTWSISGQISCGGTTNQGITWTGQAGDNLWNTAGNWTNNTIPGVNDVAFFNNAICVAAQCNAQINSNLSARGINLQSTYTGTLTQNATRTLTVGTGGYNQTAGTFAGGDAAVAMNGAFTLSGGTYTATSGTWTQSANMTISGAPTFNHNSGTWLTGSTISISPNGATFNNVRLEGASQAYIQTLTGNMIVLGDLILAAASTNGSAINSGTIEARGNVIVLNEGKSGSTVIKINGTGAQSLDASTAVNAKLPSIEIDKSSGTLTILGTVHPRGTSWSHLNGTVDVTGTTINFRDSMTIIPGTINYNNIIFGGVNSGVVHTLSGGTMVVNGTLYLAADSTAGSAINTGTIEARGNILVQSQGKSGNVILRINGTGAQSLDATTAVNGKVPNIEINKVSGTLTMAGTLDVRGTTWIYIGGTVDASTSHLVFGLSTTITPGPVIYNDATFGGTSSDHQNINNQTMFLNGNLSLNATGLTSNLNSGTIEVGGNVNVTNEGKSGSALIKFAGAGAQALNALSAATNRLPNVEINKPSGTLTLVGIITCINNWTWTAGTVDAGTSSLRFTNGNASIIPGSMTYNNVSFMGAAGTQNLNGGTMIVNGITSIAGISISSVLSNGTIEAYGNVSVLSNGNSGTAILKFKGASSTTLTWTAGTFLSTTLQVEKNIGSSVLLATNALFSTAGRDFTITSGTLDLNGFDFNVNDVLTVGVGATLKCNGGEIVNPQPVSIVNSGTINCPGYSTYDFNWTGAGGDVNWNTAGNWQGGVAPVATDIVVFQDTYCGGTCNATINVAANVRGVRMYSPFSGTITQANTLAVGSRGWVQNAGTFTGNNNTISIGGNYSLTAGTFASTSSTLTYTGQSWNASGGLFSHNNGTFISNAGTPSVALNMGANTFYNSDLVTWAGNYTITGSVTINNHFRFGTASGSGTSLVGTVNALADVTCLNNGAASGTGVVNISGTGVQNVTSSATCQWPGVTINKSAGAANLSGTLIVNGPLVYVTGSVDPGTSHVSFMRANGTTTHQPNGLTLANVSFSHIASSAIYNLSNQTLNATGTLTFNASIAGPAINSGTINASGNIVQNGTVSITGSVNLAISGATDTTITQAAGVAMPGATVTVNKGANKVTLLGATRFNNAGQNLTVTAGTLDMAGFNLTVGNNISNSGTIQRGVNPTCGTISQGGSYTGNAAVCP